MNQKNNHLDYTLKVWLSISVLAPTLSALADLVIDNSSLELIVVGVLFFTIFFATTVSLPFYFLLKKISKIVYEFNLPNQQVRLLLTLVVFFFIFATHILFYHKTLNQVSSLESGINYYIKFFSYPFSWLNIIYFQQLFLFGILKSKEKLTFLKINQILKS